MPDPVHCDEGVVEGSLACVDYPPGDDSRRAMQGDSIEVGGDECVRIGRWLGWERRCAGERYKARARQRQLQRRGQGRRQE